MKRSVAALYGIGGMKLDDKSIAADSLATEVALVRNTVSAVPDWTMVREYYIKRHSTGNGPVLDTATLRAVLVDAMSGVFDVLLVNSLDPLSEDRVWHSRFLCGLYASGVEVISTGAATTVNLSDEIAKAIRSTPETEASPGSGNAGDLVRARMRRAVQEGRWSGGRPPYGFRLSERRGKGALPLEVDENEATVVREMCRLYIQENLGSRRIAAWLNEKGILTREGKLWRDCRVRSILRNPMIAGLLSFERHRRRAVRDCLAAKNHSEGLGECIIPRDELGNPKPIPEYQIISLSDWCAVDARMRANDSRTH